MVIGALSSSPYLAIYPLNAESSSLNPLRTGNTISANTEDPNEMPLKVAFHLVLHCLLINNQFSEKDFFSEVITCSPSIYICN